MATIRPAAHRPTLRWNPVLYWAATGLFCVLFVYSGVWSILDPDGTRAVMAALGLAPTRA